MQTKQRYSIANPRKTTVEGEVVKGYQRYIQLDGEAGQPTDGHGKPKDQAWYGIGKGNPVRTFAENRLEALS